MNTTLIGCPEYVYPAHPGAPYGTKWVAVAYTNDTLHALNACCAYTVHRSGLDGCLVWCQLEDGFLDSLEPPTSLLRNISTCMEKAVPGIASFELAADRGSASALQARSAGLKGLILAALLAGVTVC